MLLILHITTGTLVFTTLSHRKLWKGWQSIEAIKDLAKKICIYACLIRSNSEDQVFVFISLNKGCYCCSSQTSYFIWTKSKIIWTENESVKSGEDAIQKKTSKKFFREMKNCSKAFLSVFFFFTIVSLPEDELIFASDSQEEDAMIRQVK